MTKRSAYGLIAMLLISLITIDRLGRASVPADGSRIRQRNGGAFEIGNGQFIAARARD